MRRKWLSERQMLQQGQHVLKVMLQVIEVAKGEGEGGRGEGVQQQQVVTLLLLIQTQIGN